MATITKTKTILTRHPQGKQGTNIDAEKYSAMKAAILRVLKSRPDGVLAKELPQLVQPKLSKTVYPASVSISWYCVTVKLDLEARKLIRRIPKSSPQRIHLTGRSS